MGFLTPIHTSCEKRDVCVVYLESHHWKLPTNSNLKMSQEIEVLRRTVLLGAKGTGWPQGIWAMNKNTWLFRIEFSYSGYVGILVKHYKDPGIPIKQPVIISWKVRDAGFLTFKTLGIQSYCQRMMAFWVSNHFPKRMSYLAWTKAFSKGIGSLDRNDGSMGRTIYRYGIPTLIP